MSIKKATTGMPHFTVQVLHFLQIEGLWQPCLEQVYQRHFPNSICTLRVLVSHFGNSLSISDLSIIIILAMVICGS